MGVENMTHVHQFSQPLRCVSDINTKTVFYCCYRSHVVCRGADTANPGGDQGHLEKFHALQKLLETADLENLKVPLADLSAVIHIQCDPCMTLYSGHRIDY